MFDITKFGGYLCRLRKNADMTQSELANKLDVTHQAISRYEKGLCFPDISILVLLAEIFNVTLDELINAGEPSKGESNILENVAKGNSDIAPADFQDIVGLAPMLKPSVLAKLSENCKKQGVDISNIVELAEYLNDDAVLPLVEEADFRTLNDELMKKLLPLLDMRSKQVLFERMFNGELDLHFIEIILPYAEEITSQIEAAVIEGALPNETLDLLRRCRLNENGYKFYG